MTTGSRPRFSVRVGLSEAPEHDGPFEDVPRHLLTPLQTWVNDSLRYQGYAQESEARAICLRLRISADQSVHSHYDSAYLRSLREAVGTQLLDVVDEILRLPDLEGWKVDGLSSILDDAGSAYRVNQAGDGLEERVTPAVRDAVHQTIADAATGSNAGSAADHLREAWQAAYGRGPDPVRAYSEAIKAVECAAHAVIQPNHAKATLGTMLGEIKNARHKFSAAIPSPTGDSIVPAEAMMRALWEGQTSRHGAQTATVPETLEAARAGVHLAAALVQWFVSGSVVRTP
ncbi:hypothetical protein [Streptomyces cylindrosporus]|uniref:Abortive infection protein-like C-terminal domain-containing protein n=1 Tax=Streptomyces cylindrosporus TaxID=2927583 RepID=A0ABS9Y607_9ACTN|nr:hypothetical protein [Streptomyces cylindrosporus]MCI3272096.1 hypothetical protein [Streptomyces cylindrosporus]